MQLNDLILYALAILGGGMTITSPQLRALVAQVLTQVKKLWTKAPSATVLTATVEQRESDYRKVLLSQALDVRDAVGEKMPLDVFAELAKLDKPTAVQIEPLAPPAHAGGSL